MGLGRVDPIVPGPVCELGGLEGGCTGPMSLPFHQHQGFLCVLGSKLVHTCTTLSPGWRAHLPSALLKRAG